MSSAIERSFSSETATDPPPMIDPLRAMQVIFAPLPIGMTVPTGIATGAPADVDVVDFELLCGEREGDEQGERTESVPRETHVSSGFLQLVVSGDSSSGWGAALHFVECWAMKQEGATKVADRSAVAGGAS